MFVRDGDRWKLQQVITLSDASQANGFGFAVALRQDTLVVGAPFSSDSALLSGAAYVYGWNGSRWEQQQRFKASQPSAESRFGSSLGFDGDTLVIGASQEDVASSNRAGAVYAYTRDGSSWHLLQRLVSATVRPLAQFGFSLAVRAGVLVVAAPHNPQETASNRSGEVYIFQRNGEQYEKVDLLEAPQPMVGDCFGASLALNASALLVGASEDGRAAQSTTRATAFGGVYLYARNDLSQVRSASLKAPNADAGDDFGRGVALTDDYLVIGAPNEDSGSHGINSGQSDNTQTDSGAIYVLR
jgi:hypothetical protein